jgi:hypothetical protein
MHVLLYVLTALTFFAGTQLFVLSDHTDQFFSWTIANPMSAAFIGAGFWGASVVVFWCARQREWTRGRVVVPTVAVVATMLLVATLQNLEAFHGLLGLAWIEVYAIFPPILGAITVMQLAVPGTDPHSGQRVPGGLRMTLAVQGVVAIVVGVLLFASSPSLADDLWAWTLTDLTSKAVGTWLVGRVADRRLLREHAGVGLLRGDAVLAGGSLRADERRGRDPGRDALPDLTDRII